MCIISYSVYYIMRYIPRRLSRPLQPRPDTKRTHRNIKSSKQTIKTRRPGTCVMAVLVAALVLALGRENGCKIYISTYIYIYIHIYISTHISTRIGTCVTRSEYAETNEFTWRPGTCVTVIAITHVPGLGAKTNEYTETEMNPTETKSK